MDRVSVVTPQTETTKSKVGDVTPLTQSESEFARDDSTRSSGQIARGAAEAGAAGSVVGGVVAGLTTLAFPAFSGAVVLVGMAAGAFYGAISGGVLVGGTDNHITTEQTTRYTNFLDRGHYLVSIQGNQTEIDRAESVLKAANVRDWMVFTPI
jgi:outer membrane lipoprotein SlyB